MDLAGAGEVARKNLQREELFTRFWLRTLEFPKGRREYWKKVSTSQLARGQGPLVPLNPPMPVAAEVVKAFIFRKQTVLKVNHHSQVPETFNWATALICAYGILTTGNRWPVRQAELKSKASFYRLQCLLVSKSDLLNKISKSTTAVWMIIP